MSYSMKEHKCIKTLILMMDGLKKIQKMIIQSLWMITMLKAFQMVLIPSLKLRTYT